MARFKTGDRVRVNITIGSIYDRCGTIIDHVQSPYFIYGQIYSTPSWKVQFDNGECITINERYLNPVRNGDNKE